MSQFSAWFFLLIFFSVTHSPHLMQCRDIAMLFTIYIIWIALNRPTNLTSFRDRAFVLNVQCTCSSVHIFCIFTLVDMMCTPFVRTVNFFVCHLFARVLSDAVIQMEQKRASYREKCPILKNIVSEWFSSQPVIYNSFISPNWIRW